eukprot:8931956-Pyramimonas_sp.AAC.1
MRSFSSTLVCFGSADGRRSARRRERCPRPCGTAGGRCMATVFALHASRLASSTIGDFEFAC